MIVLIFVGLGILGYLILSEKPAVFKFQILRLFQVKSQILVIVTNIGDLKGTYTLALKINMRSFRQIQLPASPIYAEMWKENNVNGEVIDNIRGLSQQT